MKLILIALITILAGCSTLQVPKEVLVPVSVPCIAQIPIKGYFMSHEELKSLNEPDYVLSITAEYLKYEIYTGRMEAALSACK